jgi:argininosuccinate lyase
VPQFEFLGRSRIDNAGHCLRLAQALELPDIKAMLLEMAQAWADLAKQAWTREQGAMADAQKAHPCSADF